MAESEGNGHLLGPDGEAAVQDVLKEAEEPVIADIRITLKKGGKIEMSGNCLNDPILVLGLLSRLEGMYHANLNKAQKVNSDLVRVPAIPGLRG